MNKLKKGKKDLFAWNYGKKTVYVQVYTNIYFRNYAWKTKKIHQLN